MITFLKLFAITGILVWLILTVKEIAERGDEDEHRNG